MSKKESATNHMRTYEESRNVLNSLRAPHYIWLSAVLILLAGCAGTGITTDSLKNLKDVAGDINGARQAYTQSTTDYSSMCPTSLIPDSSHTTVSTPTGQYTLQTIQCTSGQPITNYVYPLTVTVTMFAGGKYNPNNPDSSPVDRVTIRCGTKKATTGAYNPVIFGVSLGTGYSTSTLSSKFSNLTGQNKRTTQTVTGTYTDQTFGPGDVIQCQLIPGT